MAVLPRQYIDCDFSDDYRCRDGGAWSLWVRWLVLALIIIGAVAIFCIFSCVTARLRRKRGFKPYRGTAWTLGRTPPGHGAAVYNPQPDQQQQQHARRDISSASLPSYAQASGQGHNDVELQAPQPSYAGGGGVQHQQSKDP